MPSEKSPGEHNSYYVIEITVQVNWKWVVCISLDLIISQKTHRNLNMGSWYNYFTNYKSVARLSKSWVRVPKEGQSWNESPPSPSRRMGSRRGVCSLPLREVLWVVWPEQAQNMKYLPLDVLESGHWSPASTEQLPRNWALGAHS